jgi:hypothetical protein
MENENYQDEFEQFLQDEVKQHRMYPSDHIWKNIRTEMHGYSAWPALTFISLFIITTLTVSTLLINHPAQFLVKSPSALNNRAITKAPKTFMLDVNTQESPIENYFQQTTPEQLIANAYTEPTQNNIDRENTISSVDIYNTSSSLLSHTDELAPQIINAPNKINPASLSNQSNADVTANMASSLSIEKTVSGIEDNPAKTAVEVIAEGQTQTLINTTQQKPEKITSVDDYLRDFGYTADKTPHRKVSKFGFQIYVTPSTSYRTLSDEKVKEVIQATAASSSVISQIAPLSVNYATYSNNVNHVVRHRPAMGLELGFAVLYSMSDRIKFKTGLQLNVRQYYIETFQSRTNDLTTLSVINQRGVETINFYSPYNNNTGYKQTELDNKLYQVSVPIGIQWDMIKGKHFGINTEASVQPTLTLNTNTYLLTTDYNHYTDGSEFIRKWNINTSLGLNLTYKSGSTSWQIGPQIRYQHLPTYSNLYPIKEFLIDYGVRLGFTKQLR